MKKGLRFIGVGTFYFVALAVSGCETVSTGLDKTGDVLGGDFRMLANAKPATLNEIWRDWKENEVTAKDKWNQQAVVVPGIVTRITKTGILAQTSGGLQNQIAVIFSDPTNPKCTGEGIARDDLMVNAKKIADLKTGDRVNVTGVLGTTAAMYTSANANSCYFSFQKAKIEPATAAI